MNLNESTAWVADLLDVTGSDSHAAEQNIRFLAREQNIKGLIDSILQNKEWLEEVAQRSYRHALGFDKFVIVSLLPRGQLRLHVWWPDVPRLAEHVHSHRFSFSSAIVTGRLRNIIFAESGSAGLGEEFNHYIESAAIAEAQWKFTELQSAWIRVALATNMPAATSYTMTPDVLHRVEALEPLTVTVLLETAPVKDHTFVFVPKSEPQPTRRAQGRFSPHEVRDQFTQLLGLL